jgi:hypothetical protein
MLTSQLQWPKLPLFCVGGFSALQVGPGTFNLGGMREAADRVVERLEELALGGDTGQDGTHGREREGRDPYTYFDFDLLSDKG